MSAQAYSRHFALDARTAPALDAGFVAEHLAVQFVGQFVNGSIQIEVFAASVQGIAFDVDAAFCALTALFLGFVVGGEQHLDMNDLVKVAHDALQFCDHVGTQCRAHFQVISCIDVTDVSTILSGLNQSNLAQHYPLLRIADQLLDKENTHYFINSQEFTNALTTYQQMLVGITSSLKHVNPNVEIIVATQYNPYAEFADHTLFHSFYEGMEDCVSKLNETIIAGADAGGYTIADVKTGFQDAHAKTNDLCNADPDIASINLDFHPNADGHTVLAEVFKAAIERSQTESDRKSVV